jgi:tRNA G18 (ribose-2'-O)-methylase SpoU
MSAKNQSLYLVLDNIRSRENVGSIFRTADAAGVAKIYLCGITPTPDDGNPSNFSESSSKLSKTALGAEKWVPWEYYKQTFRLLSSFDKKKFCIIALELNKKSDNIFKIKLPKNKNIIIVLGNEVKGLSRAILKRADKIAAIPMHGRKESLNVAVAAGVALYQLRK